MPQFNFINLGLVNYQEGLIQQEKLFGNKLQNAQQQDIILCEHPHVYTFGKSADPNHLLANNALLKSINAQKYSIKRGGDITYHGPGQLVGYPILNLHTLKIGIKKYVWLLEESLIQTLAIYNIHCKRIKNLTGIWLSEGVDRKIGAIGIQVSRGITMHGFALNANTNLEYFKHIVPCGIADKGVTSMKNELRESIDIAELKKHFEKVFKKVFDNAKH